MYQKFLLFSWVCILLACSSTKNTNLSTTETTIDNNSLTASWKTASSGGYTYRYVENDPMKARFYTLDNGLKVILSENNTEPKIEYRMAIRSGSNNDPRAHTGLAHYLEHMVFKGTDKYGSADWEKERVLIDEIEQLYEQLNQESDQEKRNSILKKIDETSGKAAQYAITGEYDQMMKLLGTTGTNAWTSFEETVYTEAVPNNVVNQLLTLQAERFRYPVFRLFHTELETVYEEKNQSIDDDETKVYETILANVFPSHNYGQQTTIGTIEHLKNPSLKAIRAFYNKHYVPNNMGLILVGDFDSDEMIAKIEAAFGYMKAQPLENYQGPKEKPINGPIIKEVTNTSAQYVVMGYRTPKAYSKEALMTTLIESILNNGKTGLIDQNLTQRQKLLDVGIFNSQMKDYGVMMFYAFPFEGQKLGEAKDLLQEQIRLLQEGQFPNNLIPAIVANKKLELYTALKYQGYRANALVSGFILGDDQQWDKEVQLLDNMQKITKEEVMAYAKQLFTEQNYVVVYKKKGEETKSVSIKKPPITPITTYTEKSSDFVKQIKSMPSTSIAPVWVDFDEAIQKTTVGKAPLLYVQNQENELFTLSYHFDFGSNEYPLLPMAAKYLQLANTQTQSADSINQSFYQMASSYEIEVTEEETTLTLTGLQEHFKASVGLLEDKLHNSQVNAEIIENLIEAELTVREDNKLNKGTISFGLFNYANYGPTNPFNTVLSNEMLQAITANELVSLLKSLSNIEHYISYYGPVTNEEIVSSLEVLHPTPAIWLDSPEKVIFPQAVQSKNKVLFVDFDDVQTEVYWIRNLPNYNSEQDAAISAFNSYFGEGVGSLMFKEVREKKALAYSSYGMITLPYKKDLQPSFMGFVGCQADKLPESIETVNGLLNTLPVSSKEMENSKNTLISNLNAERIQREDYIYRFLTNKQRGFTNDIRKDKYQKLQQLSDADIQQIHQQYLAGSPFTYLVIGSKEKVDIDFLKQFGEVQELSLEEVFGYGPVVRKEGPAVEITEGEYRIEGRILGGMLSQITLAYELDGEKKTETSKVKNGKFVFKGKVPAHPIRATFILSDESLFEYYVFLEQGLTKVSINLEKNKTDLFGLKGTPLNEQYIRLYNSTKQQFKQAYTLMDEYYEKDAKGENVKHLEDKINNLFQDASHKQEKFILDNLNSVVAAYTMDDNIYSFQMHPTLKMDSLYQAFSDEVKAAPIGQQLKEKVENLKKLGIGKPALEIAMPNPEGEIMSLSSQQGQYVLLDFWATWCGPCVKELPHLQKVYEKYHDKGFEVYAVSLDTRGGSWKNFIQKRDLTWINVSDLKDDNAAAKAYSVSEIPNNFLINPEGMIIGWNLSVEELNEQLDELLKD